MDIDGAAVFSATMHKERNNLGREITSWLEKHPYVTIVDKMVKQSSDTDYHCLSIILFYKKNKEVP